MRVQPRPTHIPRSLYGWDEACGDVRPGLGVAWIPAPGAQCLRGPDHDRMWSLHCHGVTGETYATHSTNISNNDLTTWFVLKRNRDFDIYFHLRFSIPRSSSARSASYSQWERPPLSLTPEEARIWYLDSRDSRAELLLTSRPMLNAIGFKAVL